MAKDTVAVATKGIIVTDDNKELNINEMVATLSKLKKGQKISGEYWTPEPSEIKRCFFIGFKQMRKKYADQLPADQQMTDVVKLLCEDGETVVNGDSVIVSSCRGLSIPTPIEITCTGVAESPRGKYKEFDINILN